MEIEQSSEAIVYRQNPTAHPEYLGRVFTDLNRCIERKGWKLLSAQQEQGSQSGASEFSHAGYPAPRSEQNAKAMVGRGVEGRLAGMPSATH